MELLNHLKHPHPLVLSEEKYDDVFPCMICWDCVSGLCYCCNECTFVVHKWCAELPIEITNHQLHPDHPRLVLLSAEERDREDDAVCEDCKLEISISYAFSCKECLFVIHPECVLLPKLIEFEFNDEDSLPVRKELTFKKRTGGWSPCNLCKQGLENSWYAELHDDSESFHIHCARLPKTVKHDNHLHDLTLHVSIDKEKDYIGCYCDLCEGERDVNQWLYYCAKCEVAGHLTCGLLKSPPLYKGILTSNRVYTVKREEPPVADDSEEYMGALERRTKKTQENEKPLGEIVHFSHEHHLFLFDDVWNGLYTCRACETCVYGKVYICYECKFFLHKWCAELPQEVHFGFHLQHPLTLLSKHNLGCSYCKVRSDAFIFSCLECDFGVHTICAFLYELGVHKSHVHPLQIMILTSYEHDWAFIGKIPVKSGQISQCNACLFPCDGMSLGCEECDFYLHVGCSLYPPTGKAETHRHNLNLTYSYQEDPIYTEFICDACEKPRTPNCWIYCCPDPKCDIVAHLDCCVPNLFPTSSSSMIKYQEDCSSSSSSSGHDKEERDPDCWVYYRPSPSLHLLHGFELPNLDHPLQRILKSDLKYAFLKDKVSRGMPKPEELQHFSHEHPLVLSNEKWNGEVKCEACSRGIYGKTYICHKCGFYLHKWCAQIPRELHFRLHSEHPLTLLPGHDFECSVCEVSSFGFSFFCEKCHFEAHTLCALIPDRDNLEIHKHPADIVFNTPKNPTNPVTKLLFPVQNGQIPICDACRFPCQGMTMECKRCDFHLHVDCAWYPRTINNEAHMHTLALDNSANFPPEIIRISHRHFCDICDKALTARCWGYICLDEKCNTTAAHLDCALPNLFLTPSFQSILVDPDQ